MKGKRATFDTRLGYLAVLFIAVACSLVNDIASKEKQVNIFYNIDDSAAYISIGIRGNMVFVCADSLVEIGENKKIFASTLKEELKGKWKFTAISNRDTALFSLGSYTPQFYLNGYDSNNNQIWTIAVHCSQNKIYGIYHTKLGRLKPVSEENLCYYILPLAK